MVSYFVAYGYRVRGKDIIDLRVCLANVEFRVFSKK